MRITVVGAGPAGLHFAILVKRADAAHDLTVLERNTPDATYGWGVVFSEETLTELRDADYPSYVALDEALVRWDAVEIRYRGQRLRSRGHGFSAIARTTLLRILQDRARELGVSLRFGEDVTDLEALGEHDLLVGADGIRSAVRAARAKAFEPTFEEHAAKYVWFGTDLVLDVFTFIFAETEHGLFQVHAYPFDGRTSTFIVETSPATWASAGLDRMSEEQSLAFCQQLFAEHLQGHRLLSNKSLWSSFVTVRNRSWHDGDTVLLGDAAHTAHFSIGSGTKLAMEDAAALAKAFQSHGEDLPATFAEYELERQTPVERFQEAASDSARYFETVSRYVGFDPEQFAFNLLTRSGRITRANLELRDAAVVNRVDRWVHRRADRTVTGPAFLASLRVGEVEIANRVALTGVEHSGAGAGLVVSAPIAVSREGRITPDTPGLWADEQTGPWKDAVRRCAEAGSVLALRLSHAGRRGGTRPPRRAVDRPLREPWQLLAPGAQPYTPRSPVPKAMTVADRERVTVDFGAAARRAAEAGARMVLVDCADGYLLASFLSPLTNPGNLDERTAFPLAVLDAVRESFGGVVGVRLVCDDRVPGGLDPDEAVRIAGRVRDHGAELVDVTSGHTISADRGAADYRRLYQVGLADQIRNEAGVPVVASGRITTLDEVSTVVAAGRADLCVLDPRRYR